MNMVEFLRARLDDDESAARAAEDVDASPWKAQHGWRVETADGFTVVHVEDSTPSGPTIDHIARWDPARVLAEVAAKRRIVEWVEGAQDAAGEPPGFEAQDAEALTYALWLLAQPYREHPDFEPAWPTMTATADG